MSLCLVFLCILLNVINSADVTLNIDFSNVTNIGVSKYIFGVNSIPYKKDDNVLYTIIRSGGEGQTRYNWNIGAYDSATDWYFISNPSHTWQEMTQPTIDNGMDLLVQIPAMGFVSKTTSKVWSFSQAKYGAQQKNECSDQPNGCTWCAKDAGNGIWVNGTKVSGNDPYDASERVYPENGTAWVNALIGKYGINKAKYYSIDNEPQLWNSIHWDVHPNGSTYEETFGILKDFGGAIKESESCNKECKIMGPSSWGWCGYFTDGHDKSLNGCTDGPDRQQHNNMPILQWYLQQSSQYEKQYGYRLLDILDVHYYPQGTGVSGCNEDEQSATNRLQAPRSLYDWSYIDPSWIKEPIALIPRLRNWIDTTYPGTNISISEHNFGGDTCITSVIAHAEVLSIAATYGVEIMTRWVQPDVGTPVINSYNIYTNYDGKGSNIYGNGHNTAYNVMSNNIESVTGYTFAESDASKVYVYLFNKDKSQSNITIKLNNGKFTTNGIIDLYVINNNGLTYMGQCNNKPNSTSFSVVMSQWTVMFAIINQN